MLAADRMVTVGVREGVTEAGGRAVVKDRTAALTREGAPKLGSEGEVGKEARESPTWHPALLSEAADLWPTIPRDPRQPGGSKLCHGLFLFSTQLVTEAPGTLADSGPVAWRTGL